MRNPYAKPTPSKYCIMDSFQGIFEGISGISDAGLRSPMTNAHDEHRLRKYELKISFRTQ